MKTFELTESEQKILTLLSLGLTSNQIAISLNVNTSTVNNRLSHLYSKTGHRKREKLLSWAVENQLIDRSKLPSDIDPKYFRVPINNRIGRRVDIDEITPTETKILNLLVQGFSNKDIADNLFVAQRTVESHISRLLIKTGQENRTALAMWVLNCGQIEFPQDLPNKQVLQPNLKEGQYCQVRLYKNSSSSLNIYNESLVKIFYFCNRGAICTNLKGELIKDIFYCRELLPIDETKPIAQEIELSIEQVKQLANYGLSINDAIANLLDKVNATN